jgi:hypothetical protein
MAYAWLGSAAGKFNYTCQLSCHNRMVAWSSVFAAACCCSVSQAQPVTGVNMTVFASREFNNQFVSKVWSPGQDPQPATLSDGFGECSAFGASAAAQRVIDVYDDPDLSPSIQITQWDVHYPSVDINGVLNVTAVFTQSSTSSTCTFNASTTVGDTATFYMPPTGGCTDGGPANYVWALAVTFNGLCR